MLLVSTVWPVYLLLNKKEAIETIFKRSVNTAYVYVILSLSLSYIPGIINSFFERIFFVINHDFINWELLFDILLIFILTGIEMAMLLSKHYTAELSMEEIDKLLTDDQSSLYPKS